MHRPRYYLKRCRLLDIAVVAAFSFVGSFLLLKVVDFITPVRVSAADEETGLDQSQHGEEAYTVG